MQIPTPLLQLTKSQRGGIPYQTDLLREDSDPDLETNLQMTKSLSSRYNVFIVGIKMIVKTKSSKKYSKKQGSK